MSRFVLLRAASGPAVGVGHVMRTLAVAEALAARGARTELVVDDETARELCRERGFDARLAGEGLSWCAPGTRAAWLDGKRDWTRALELLRAANARTVLVENRTSRALADHLVYPALHHEHDAWDRAHAPRVHAGAEWIPLARSVLATRPAAERDVDLLVTFGGSDPKRLTERALCALEGFGGRVVVSAGAHMRARRDGLAALARALPRAELLPAGTPLAPWMARSRRALTALGTTLYELAWLDVPALVLANYAEDRPALAHYAAHGPHRPLGIADELDAPSLRTLLAHELERPAAPLGAFAPALSGGSERNARLLLGGQALQAG